MRGQNHVDRLETARQADGQTDRQTDRQTGRQTDRRTDGQGETNTPSPNPRSPEI